jgi:hypothetical protein
MKFEPGKLLQNIELKLRGRTAMVAIGEGVMAVALWLVMKDYAAHPLFSTIWGTGLVAGILAFLALTLLGRARPEEVPDKSFMHVDQLGIYVAQGIGSHKDMVHLMREVSGLKKIPAPSHYVRGVASNPKDYVPLTSEQSNAVIAKVEEGIEKFLSGFVNQATAESSEPQIADSSAEKPEPAANKGKTLTS